MCVVLWQGQRLCLHVLKIIFGYAQLLSSVKLSPHLVKVKDRLYTGLIVKKHNSHFTHVVLQKQNHSYIYLLGESLGQLLCD